ncbi:hypothetical protein CUMW_076780 [Citrus unshiu]|nr:hypothetical protein CUMW_076780 [Citrus unshiu]
MNVDAANEGESRWRVERRSYGSYRKEYGIHEAHAKQRLGFCQDSKSRDPTVTHITKLFINHPLPQSAKAFSVGAPKYFESVLDVNVVAKYCDGLMGGNLGLSKLAKILGVERLGEAHNAGSDSFVTAAVFAKMKEKFEFEERVFDGILSGMDEGIMNRSIHMPRRIIPTPRHCQPLIPHQPPTFMTQGFTASIPRPVVLIIISLLMELYLRVLKAVSG